MRTSGLLQIRFSILLLLVTLGLHLSGEAQSVNTQNLFIPSYQDQAPNVYRSAKGTPGPLYWQNTADYSIHATLNDKDSSITGEVTISYTNNSPDKLDYLWLQLDQNIFDPKSRGSLTTPVTGDRFDVKGYSKGGFHIGQVIITYQSGSYKAQPVISDARMQLRLQTPMKPKGDKISLKISYNFSIPTHGADRMGRFTTTEGQTYEIAQWYPRMCVYDDVQGWNTLPYMGLGEFYCEYGDYDYYITAPANMIIYGSGDLQNQNEVLTQEEIKRLASAKNSDKTIFIVRPEEVGKPQMRPVTKGSLTWHYKMHHTRDVAWTASAALVWDAARINLPSGRHAMAMSAYPLASIGPNAYTRGTEYLKNSIEIYSKAYFEYPWNNAINIGGIVTGMEYPGIIYDDYTEEGPHLFDLIAHEIGHNWYPMIVGSNERQYMWQDEGFNSFINRYAASKFNNGEFAADSSMDTFMRFTDELFTVTTPLMAPPEAMPLNEFNQYYNKTAWGLTLLRSVIIGEDRFDFAFRKYTQEWAFRHPTPYDFFHAMNNAAGEDLGWFWKEWFFTTANLDQAITKVETISDSALITVENKKPMIMPVTAKIIMANGSSDIVKLPVEIWQRDGAWTFRYICKSPIKQIVLDPDKLLPDIDRSNNVWTSGK